MKSENRENSRRLHEACMHSRQKGVCGDCGPAAKGYDRPMAKRRVERELSNELPAIVN